MDDDASTDFKAKYDQPFTLAQAVELDVPILTAEITRLQNSIHHLTLSNAEIETYISTEDDEQDRKEFESVVKENEDVISAQQERILLIRHALQQKLGRDQATGLEHYDSGAIQGVLRGGVGVGVGGGGGGGVGADTEGNGMIREAGMMEEEGMATGVVDGVGEGRTRQQGGGAGNENRGQEGVLGWEEVRRRIGSGEGNEESGGQVVESGGNRAEAAVEETQEEEEGMHL